MQTFAFSDPAFRTSRTVCQTSLVESACDRKGAQAETIRQRSTAERQTLH